MSTKEDTYVRPTWDEYFMEVARTIAKRATCDRGRSGCVIAKDNQLLVTGYVGSPAGLPHCDDVGHLMRKMIHDDGSFHWYIDIADYTWNDARDTLTMTDLLADVIVDENGCIRVTDLDELADAHTQGLISDDLLKKSLYTLDRLLRELYAHGISRLSKPIMELY